MEKAFSIRGISTKDCCHRLKKPVWKKSTSKKCCEASACSLHTYRLKTRLTKILNGILAMAWEISSTWWSINGVIYFEQYILYDLKFVRMYTWFVGNLEQCVVNSRKWKITIAMRKSNNSLVRKKNSRITTDMKKSRMFYKFYKNSLEKVAVRNSCCQRGFNWRINFNSSANMARSQSRLKNKSFTTNGRLKLGCLIPLGVRWSQNPEMFSYETFDRTRSDSNVYDAVNIWKKEAW